MHPSTEAILKFFEYEHLPPKLQAVSIPFSELAWSMVANAENQIDFDGALRNLCETKLDGPELTMALRKLLEAKDCAVRAAL